MPRVCAVGWPASTADAAVGSGVTGREVDCAFAGAPRHGPFGAGRGRELQRHHRSEKRTLRTVCVACVPDRSTSSTQRPAATCCRPSHPTDPSATGSTAANDPGADDPATGSGRCSAARRDRDPPRWCADLSVLFVHRQPARLEPAEPLRSPAARLLWLHPRPVHPGLQREWHRRGEVAGTAPACAPPTSPAGFGSAAGGCLARGQAGRLRETAGGSRRRYQMVLSPGRYRITSGRLPPRQGSSFGRDWSRTSDASVAVAARRLPPPLARCLRGACP